MNFLPNFVKTGQILQLVSSHIRTYTRKCCHLNLKVVYVGKGNKKLLSFSLHTAVIINCYFPVEIHIQRTVFHLLKQNLW